MSKPDYTVKVDALLAHATALGFTEQDFADLALAAADQAGVGVAKQNQIAALLLTDERVETLLEEATAREDVEMIDLCETALKTIVQPNLKRQALARIGEMLNAVRS